MFNYFGSKQRLASTYQPPAHDIIIEPFAGAAGYAMYWLTRQAEMTAILYDSDPLVVGLWERLLGMDPQDLWDYPNPIKGEMSDDLLWGMTPSAPAVWATVGAGKRFTITAWTARDFPEMKRRIASTLAVVRGRVDVHHANYTEAPDMEATWFIDPPYQKEGHQYTSGNAIDFAALGEWCRSRRGEVIVCESLGADWLEFVPHRMTKTQVNTDSTEVVWYSHPEPTLLDFQRRDSLSG